MHSHVPLILLSIKSNFIHEKYSVSFNRREPIEKSFVFFVSYGILETDDFTKETITLTVSGNSAYI